MVSHERLAKHLELAHGMKPGLVRSMSFDGLLAAHELVDRTLRVRDCSMCRDAIEAGVQADRVGKCAGCGRSNPVDFGEATH